MCGIKLRCWRYYRILLQETSEMKELTASYQADKLEFIKNPVIILSQDSIGQEVD